jgi:hypothetical protein
MKVEKGDRAIAYQVHKVEVLTVEGHYAFCDGSTFYGWLRLENLVVIEAASETSQAA